MAVLATALLIFLVISTIYLYPLANIWVKTYIAFLNPTKENFVIYQKALKDNSFIERNYPDKFIPSLSVWDDVIQNSVENSKETTLLPQMPEGITVIRAGELGKNVVQKAVAKFSGLKKETILDKYNYLPVNQKEIVGTEPFSQTETKVKENFSVLIKSLNEDTQLSYFKQEILVSNKALLDGVSILSVNLFKDFKFVTNGENIRIGILELEMDNCSGYNTLNIFYNMVQNSIEFGDVDGFVNRLCLKRFEDVNGEITGTCADCTWFPVNKIYALKSSFEPQTVFLDTIPGGQSVSKAVLSDLLDLNAALHNAGYFLAINSGYRSYYTQAYLFEYYVSIEMANGATRAQAELIANSYSARPGHSEHQLGTAIDIANSVCGDFTANCEGNTSLYNWMLENAQNYGFVLSYPHDRVAETGYVYEPWHWRWISKEMAQEFWNLRGDMSVNTFLYNKGRY